MIKYPRSGRLPSGIDGLDEISGRFLEGGVSSFKGSPAPAKRALPTRSASGMPRRSRAAYVTLAGRDHTRLRQHLAPDGLFDESVIPDSLYYVSAFHTLEATA